MRKLEVAQNQERFDFLRWAARAFDNIHVVPPGTGIVHQVNLERLATVVDVDESGDRFAFADSLIGTDSHTTMVNAMGILGWGVGGLEAEAAMLGEPVSVPLPEVVGVRLSGSPAAGSTAMDVALYLTNLLHGRELTGSFVEFFGPGLSAMSLADRATIANMAPNTARVSLFPD